MTCWLIIGWVSLRDSPAPQYSADSRGGKWTQGEAGCPCYPHSAMCSALCFEGCQEESLVREGAAWKNKKGLLETRGFQELGGEAKDLEMTVRVARVVGKPTGLVFSPFHHLPPAQP